MRKVQTPLNMYCDVLHLFTIFQLRLISFLNQKPKNSFRGFVANLNDDQTTDLFWKKMWTNCFSYWQYLQPHHLAHTLSPFLLLTFSPYSYQHCITLHRRSQNISMPFSMCITSCRFVLLTSRNTDIDIIVSYTQCSVHRKLGWSIYLHNYHGENCCYITSAEYMNIDCFQKNE